MTPTARRTVPNQRSRFVDDQAAAQAGWQRVERAQSGDTDAFAEIYTTYHETVLRFVYFRVGSQQLAEDLTADVFTRALRNLANVTWQGRDFGAWLITIARNLVADYFKSGRYRLEYPTGDVLDADAEAQEPGPEQLVINQLSNATVLAAVNQLNPDQRQCIQLRFLDGYDVAETAKAMGRNVGAIKALQHRAVRQLRRLLPEGFTP